VTEDGRPDRRRSSKPRYPIVAYGMLAMTGLAAGADAEVERSGSLFKVLGVEPGASREEINAAYKKQARMYHPDRVATLAPEVREVAEIRMKEINAAYGQLARRGS
jgi:preprotein translocase subunit Sec63